MSEYVSELRNFLNKILESKGYRARPKGPKAVTVVKGGETVMTVTDRGEKVEISYKGKIFTYDKWYTSAERLATVIANTLES